MQKFSQFLRENSQFDNWVRLDDEKLRLEYKIEYEIKHLSSSGYWPEYSDFKRAYARGKVVEVNPKMDAKIQYRSRTKSFDDLHNLIKGYASYPEFRNDETLKKMYAGFDNGDPMPMPIVIDFGDGQYRVLGGNTRMDVAFQKGINPKVVLIEPVKGAVTEDVIGGMNTFKAASQVDPIPNRATTGRKSGTNQKAWIDRYIRTAFTGATKISSSTGFSSVYKADKYAIRVSWRPDSAYDDWVKYASTKQNEEHFPKYALAFNYKKNLSVTIMELLDPLSKDQHEFILLGFPQGSEGIKERLDYAIKKYQTDTGREDKGPWAGEYRVMEKNPRLGDVTVQVLEWATNETEHTDDMHEGNFMARGETLVIIDPIFNQGEFSESKDGADYKAEDIEIVYVSPEFEAQMNKDINEDAEH